MNPEVQQAINNINAYIVENHNNEITANVLNPILVELANLFDLVGDLSELNTTDKDSVVDAINEAISLITTGAQIHAGTADPNVTPPATYAVGDLYSRLTIGGGDPYQIYMFNGVEWGEIKRFINDAITSEEYSWSSQKIADAILGNRLLNSPTIVIDENDITISDLQWVINGNTYILSPAFTETIPYTSEAGKVRTDIIVAIQANELLRIQGVEGDVAIAPNLPANTVLVTTIDVFHDSLGDVEPPIVGELYVKKMGYRNLYLTGSVTTAPVLSEDKRNTVIQSYTGTMIIDGFKDGMPEQPSTLYEGMIVTIDNQTSEEVPINDMTNSTHPNSDIKMDFRSGISQYIMKPGELLTFKLRGTVLVFVSTNKAEVDIPTLEDVLDSGNFANQDIEFYDDDYEQIWSGDKDTNYRGMVLGTDNSVELFSKTEDNRSSIGVNELVVEVKSDNEDFKGIVGNEEFDKQGDRKAFAQIADLEDAIDNLPSFLQLGESSTTAYRGDRGKTAYDHSQETGNPHETTLQEVVDEDGTVEDKMVRFTSATPDSSRVSLNNEEVKVENVTDGESVKIGVQDIVFEQGGNELNIQPEAIDDDYNVTIQAKDHTLAGMDDVQQAVETAGFLSRTGTAISFDKWATYGTYANPESGNLSYSFTDMVRGMVVLLYHNDSVPPVITQAGVTITNSGDYIENTVNLFRIHCVDNDNLEIFVKTLN